MGRGGQERARHRSGEGFHGYGARDTSDSRWDPQHPDHDTSRDLRDIYENVPDPVTEDYIWPEQEEDED
jgi:hypothetical protein